MTPGRIAVEILDVTGSTGDRDWDAFKSGVNDMLMNDVFEARDDCGTTLLEVDRRADLIKELEFQQSPYVDPSTRVTRNGRWPDQLEALAKQLADDLCKLSDVYEVTLDVGGEGRFATHSGTGSIHTTLRARRNGPGRKVWRATGPLQWAGVSVATKIDESGPAVRASPTRHRSPACRRLHC